MTTNTPSQVDLNQTSNGAEQAEHLTQPSNLPALHNPAIGIRFPSFVDAVQALRHRLAAKPGMALMLGQGEVALLVEGALKTSFYDEELDVDAMEDFDLTPWTRLDLDYTQAECIESLERAMANDKWVILNAETAQETSKAQAGPTIMGVALPAEVHHLVFNMLKDLLQASTEETLREKRGRLYGVMRTLEHLQHPFEPGEVECIEMYFDHETNNRLEHIRSWRRA